MDRWQSTELNQKVLSEPRYPQIQIQQISHHFPAESRHQMEKITVNPPFLAKPNSPPLMVFPQSPGPHHINPWNRTLKSPHRGNADLAAGGVSAGAGQSSTTSTSGLLSRKAR